MKSADRSQRRCRPPCREHSRERGAATLVITALLLFGLSLMSLYSARVGVTEQRLAANDEQARAAFAAAQAGLDRVLADLALLDRDAIVYDPDGWATLDTAAATLSDAGSDVSAYDATADNRGLTPFRADTVHIESQGSSGDGGGARALTLTAVFSPLLPDVPPVPLLVRGGLTTSGDLALSSPARPRAAWLGGVYVAGGGALNTVLSAPSLCPPSGLCEADARLAALTPEAFFENTFGRPPAALRSVARVLSCTACDPAAAPAGTDVIWLENSGGPVAPAAGALGNEEHPVIVVVAGDFEAAAPLHIHGLLFVLGDWQGGSGTLTVDGAVAVAGDAAVVGPAQLNYDAAILEALHRRGRYSSVPGSWADF
jgi:hypothetical protein